MDVNLLNWLPIVEERLEMSLKCPGKEQSHKLGTES